MHKVITQLSEIKLIGILQQVGEYKAQSGAF